MHAHKHTKNHTCTHNHTRSRSPIQLQGPKGAAPQVHPTACVCVLGRWLQRLVQRNGAHGGGGACRAVAWHGGACSSWRWLWSGSAS